MPATTPGRNLPYPLGTDRLMDGDDQIRKLAQSVENMVQAAVVNIPFAANNTATSVTWTFPVAFADIPIVVATWQGAAGILGQTPYLACALPTVSQVLVWGIRASGGAGTAPVSVIAIGKVTAVS